jgi:transposase
MLELRNAGESYGQIARTLRKPKSTVVSAIACSSPIGNSAQENEIPQSNTAALGPEGDGISRPATGLTHGIVQLPGRRRVITPEIGREIVRLVEEESTITLLEIKGRILARFEKSISESTICRYLNDLKLTVKRTQIVPAERNSERTKRLRFEYARELGRIMRTRPGTQLVYLDESGFNLHLVRPRGRALPGISPVTTVPASPGRNLSLLQAVSRERVLYYEVYTGSINAEIFRRFLADLEPMLPDQALVIMDNARIHHAHLVQDWLAERSIPHLFLPPYSPFLNPIELTFTKIKRKVRASPVRTQNELIQAMTDGINTITGENLSGFYRHSEGYDILTFVWIKKTSSIK